MGCLQFLIVVFPYHTHLLFYMPWLVNVDMHMYARSDQNVLCGSRVMNTLTANGQLDG